MTILVFASLTWIYFKVDLITKIENILLNDIK